MLPLWCVFKLLLLCNNPRAQLLKMDIIKYNPIKHSFFHFMDKNTIDAYSIIVFIHMVSYCTFLLLQTIPFICPLVKSEEAFVFNILGTRY